MAGPLCCTAADDMLWWMQQRRRGGVTLVGSYCDARGGWPSGPGGQYCLQEQEQEREQGRAPQTRRLGARRHRAVGRWGLLVATRGGCSATTTDGSSTRCTATARAWAVWGTRGNWRRLETTACGVVGALFTCTTRRREALGGGDSEGAGGLVLSGRVGVRRTRGSAPPDSGSTVAATSTATAKTTLLRRAGWNGCWTWEGAKARLKMVPNLARLACSPSKGDALPALHTGPDRDTATTTTTMAAAPSGGSRSSLVVCSGSSSRSRGWPAGAGAGAAAGRTRWTGGRRLLLLLLFVCSRACTTHVRVCERRPSRTPQGSGL